ncbi:MAG: helix-turn-helix domain-containing protein [Oscillospiraceae bacterium]|nr:helix-turn-helix domain-containing protein [Oscillospiraceae bacterium]
MTFGEKLKQARQNASLSQEELAVKISVSRSAVAKWETDKGLPDIQNLKNIAWALGVSIDYLLDDGSRLELSVIREKIDLTRYGKGRKKVIKDKIVREKYPDSEVFSLQAEEKLTKPERIADNLLLFFTHLGEIFPLVKALNNLGKEFYLVWRGQRQYLVMVTNEFLESRELAEPMTEKKFQIGNFKYTNCGPIHYA